jgi:hypothetical protein
MTTGTTQAAPSDTVRADVRLSEADIEDVRRFVMATLQTEEERNGASFMYGALLKRFLKPNTEAQRP